MEPEIPDFQTDEERCKRLTEMADHPKDIATQEELNSPATTEALKLGINIPGYKLALKEQIEAWKIADRLTGERHSIELHWAVKDLLGNWLRAEFPGVQFGRWPWGNWWTIRLTYYDPMKRTLEKTEVSMIIR